MQFTFISKDIVKVRADAIVNTITNGIGPELLADYQTHDEIQVGQAKITDGDKLPAKYVIHTVLPSINSDNYDVLLAESYRSLLDLAKRYKLKSIAIPLLSSFSQKEQKILLSVIEDFLVGNNLKVVLVITDKSKFKLPDKLLFSLTQYLDNVENQDVISNIFMSVKADLYEDSIFTSDLIRYKRNLNEELKNLDETFSQMLLRLIDEKGMTDVETYKKANVDRRLFSKIRNDINYRPSKPTVIAFAIALQLNLDETKDLLFKAGYALSRSWKFDVIIEYFIKNKNYNIYEINEALFYFDQDLLGA